MSKNVKTGLKMEDKKEMFLKALFNRAGFIKSACEDVGISRDTYYRWTDVDGKYNGKGKYYDAGFTQRVKEVYSDFDGLAESQLIRNIQEGKETSLIFYLNNRHPERWREKRVLEHESEGFLVKFVDREKNENEGDISDKDIEKNTTSREEV
jgi:hypothetical protein